MRRGRKRRREWQEVVVVVIGVSGERWMVNGGEGLRGESKGRECREKLVFRVFFYEH